MATEKRLIDANALMGQFCEYADKLTFAFFDLDAITEEIMDAPTVDAVSRGVLDQVRWERDIALEQLADYGISLGERADVVKVVRCKDCKHREKHWITGTPTCGNPYYGMASGVDLKDDDFCSYGERKGNGKNL